MFVHLSAVGFNSYSKVERVIEQDIVLFSYISILICVFIDNWAARPRLYVLTGA